MDLPLPHLDRPFDYTVPETLAQAAAPGVRVRVRFAGQDVDGFLLERRETSDHDGRLSPLRRVVSPEPVLTPEVLRLARAVAARYAGTLSDVLRLAVPPRHGQVERQPWQAPAPGAAPVPAPVAASVPAPGAAQLAGPGAAPDAVPGAAAVPVPEPGPWADYPAGAAFLQRLAGGQAPRAVWTALPGPHWASAIATAVTATLAGGRGALVVLPDHRDVVALQAALAEALGPDGFARLEADLGPAARYRAFLALLRGQVRVGIGTRAAAFAPVSGLGLVVIWEDGDDSHAEPRAPYPQAREVLAIRAEQAGAAMLLGGWSRTAEAAQLVADGWAREIEATRSLRRVRWPRVVAAGPDSDPAARAVRMPSTAWRAIHDGLTRGPVLVQVPRVGYLPGTACRNCRRPARCPHCHGPVVLPAARGGLPASPECGWCARVLAGWTCPSCGGRALRARAVGVERTAEELGRAFPGSTVVVSRPGRTLPEPGRSALVLATPGVEPPVAGGYAAAVLLDGEVLLERPDLRAAEEALRRWRGAAALVRPAAADGLVVICADPAAAAVQALIRADPAGHAARELADRAELGLPPAVALASLTGDPAAVRGLLAAAQLPSSATVLGPAPLDEPERDGRQVGAVAGHPGAVAGHPGAAAGPAGGASRSSAGAAGPAGGAAGLAGGAAGLAGGAAGEAAGPSGSSAGAAGEPEPAAVRAVIRAPREQLAELAAALKVAAAVRSSRREPGRLRLQLDARDIG